MKENDSEREKEEIRVCSVSSLGDGVRICRRVTQICANNWGRGCQNLHKVKVALQHVKVKCMKNTCSAIQKICKNL